MLPWLACAQNINKLSVINASVSQDSSQDQLDHAYVRKTNMSQMELVFVMLV
jgi:hypothetical protein